MVFRRMATVFESVDGRSVLRILFAILFSLLLSSAVVGYQAILPVLIDAGVYASVCPGDASGCHDQ